MVDGQGRRDAQPSAGWRVIAGLLGVMALCAAAPDQSGSNPASGDLVAKGKYLTVLGDCASCHTAANGAKYAGGRYMPTPFGPISTPNITPDKKTGIGSYTDDQFVRVFHDGINAKGEYLYPVMPYPWFTKLSRDDILAIKAYLFSLKPVDAPRKPIKLTFPFNIRAGLAVYDALFLKKGEFKPDPAQSAQVNRGAFIVQTLGHCGECHNGRNLLGDTRMAAPLRGGPIQNWYAPNITSDVREGIGKYSDEQLFAFLKKGVSPGMGVAAGPMSEAIHDSVSKMTDDDIRAIVAYLKSTPPKTSFTPEERTAYTGPNPEGREIYLNYCASCHQLDGKGLPGSVPSLAGNGAVMAKGPEDVIRVVLGGIEAQGDLAPMPAIGAGMTDQQVADVVNYVRQAWENKAPPTAGAQYVAKLRPKTFTAMNIGPDGHCPTVVQKQLAPIINDPKSGVTAALRAMTNETVLQTAHDLVAKVKAEAPDAKRSDIVNSLTIAYCPVVDGNNSLSWADKVATLDNFSERVYSELQSHEKE